MRHVREGIVVSSNSLVYAWSLTISDIDLFKTITPWSSVDEDL